MLLLALVPAPQQAAQVREENDRRACAAGWESWREGCTAAADDDAAAWGSAVGAESGTWAAGGAESAAVVS